MRFFLSLLFISTFFISAFAQKGNEIELVINGIKSGTSYSSLTQKLGKPRAVLE